MPRGDGGKLGSNRRRRPPKYDNPYIPKGLARRMKWWEALGTKEDPFNTRLQGSSSDGKVKYVHTGEDTISFKRPGSQKK